MNQNFYLFEVYQNEPIFVHKGPLYAYERGQLLPTSKLPLTCHFAGGPIVSEDYFLAGIYICTSKYTIQRSPFKFISFGLLPDQPYNI